MMTLSSECECACVRLRRLKQRAVGGNRGGLMSYWDWSRADRCPDANRGMPKGHPMAST